MSGEKKFWQLPTPFRGLLGKHDPRRKARVGHARTRMSNVYLFDDASTEGFIVVPEFDNLVRTQTMHEEVDYAASSSANDGNNYLCDSETMESQNNSHLAGGSRDISGVSPSRDDDLLQRLGSAYQQIRCMPSATPTNVLLSSDPRILRKQLGVPQHSVFNHPVHSSPDLPNPHTSPSGPSSSGLPSAASLGLSCMSTSKLGTPSCSPAHHYPSLDLIQPATRENPAVAWASTGDYPPSCNVVDTPWNMHITRTPKPRLYISKPSKLVKHRVEKSPRRQAVGGVLQKKIADTPPPPTNAQKWTTSLPQIRSPSPFTVDIPLHHAWHDRQTDFKTSFVHHPKVGQFWEPKIQQTSGYTEVLASLAWIGTPPMALSPFDICRSGRSTSTPFSPDHFSMAIAVEDDSIPDDVLVDRLEKVRGIGSEHGSDLSPATRDNAHFRSTEGNENELCVTPLSSSATSDQFPKPDDLLPPSSLTLENAISDSEDAMIWKAARRTLLCVREIIRTERKYLDALKMLLNAQTATPPPPSMAPYISALVRASETLLKCFLEDPSAWGVSTAFLTSEDEVEATMVSWCAVVGAFFTDGNDPRYSSLTGRWRLRKSGGSSTSSSVTKQTSVSLSPQFLPMIPMTSTASKPKNNLDKGQHPQGEQDRQKASLSLQKLENSKNQLSTGQPPCRKPSVRDLAIQPIQRIMRYVLLYRDLLHCTPATSPSHLLVERALEAATRIANHCDTAQRNPAFSYGS